MYILQPDLFKDVNGSTVIAIPSQTTVYTRAHKVAMTSVFGLGAILASTNGTPNVKVELQVSDTNPAALAAVNDSVGADWCIQEGGSPIFTAIADKVLHKITINPTPCVYVRLKLTGNSGNQTDTTGIFTLANQQQL